MIQTVWSAYCGKRHLPIEIGDVHDWVYCEVGGLNVLYNLNVSFLSVTDDHNSDGS